MIKCKCINSFSVEKYNDDGFLLENEYEVVKEGEVWEIDEDGFRMVGGEVRLIDDNGRWLEIPLDYFDERFEELNGEEI